MLDCLNVLNHTTSALSRGFEAQPQPAEGAEIIEEMRCMIKDMVGVGVGVHGWDLRTMSC